MLHDLLKQARIAAGLTMDQAADKLGISQSTLSRIESGASGVPAQRLVDLATAYDVSPSALLDGAVVRTMSGDDLDRMAAVIEAVEAALWGATSRPSPKAISATVLAIYRQETAVSAETGAHFDPTRYAELIAALAADCYI